MPTDRFEHIILQGDWKYYFVYSNCWSSSNRPRDQNSDENYEVKHVFIIIIEIPKVFVNHFSRYLTQRLKLKVSCDFLVIVQFHEGHFSFFMSDGRFQFSDVICRR